MINFAIIVEFGGHNTSGCQSRHYTSVAQIVIPGYPHYMTQRGNRRQAFVSPLLIDTLEVLLKKTALEENDRTERSMGRKGE